MKIEINNDIEYIIGKNANENWEILDKYKNINDNYIWFHLNSFASCYVIMKSEEYTNSDLIYGAQLCKINSKYKNYNNLKIIYAPLNKLTKTNKIGEVIVSGKKKLITL